MCQYMAVYESPARGRFRRWVKWLGESQEQVAARLGCTQGHVSDLLNGHRRAGPGVGLAIERATSEWPSGPIAFAEWYASGDSEAA
jgi:transcriptional regulator with XRE-family HTH domain